MHDKGFDAKGHFGDRHSGIYDRKIREVVPGYEAMHEMARFLLQDNLPSSARILVAGAGSGREIISYAGANPGWTLVGVDPSAAMLAQAAHNVCTMDLGDRVRLVEGVVEDIVDAVRFDAATSILVMQFLPDNGEKQQYLKDISKRLKPGSKLILVDLEGERSSAYFHLMLSAWKAHQHGTRYDTDQVKADFEHVDRDLRFVPQRRIEELLSNAGFRDVHKFYQAYLFGGYIAAMS